jgi:hypothetical protein
MYITVEASLEKDVEEAEVNTHWQHITEEGETTESPLPGIKRKCCCPSAHKEFRSC